MAGKPPTIDETEASKAMMAEKLSKAVKKKSKLQKLYGDGDSSSASQPAPLLSQD